MASDFIIPNANSRIKRPRETSPLLPLRDSTAQNQMWKEVSKVNGRVNGLVSVIEQMNGRIARCERWGTVPVQGSPFYPFKIYQPSNVSFFIGQTAPMIGTYQTGAALQTCTIVDAGTPTDLTQNPPIISVADSWRFWAVREGYVEVRPNYAFGSGGPNAGTPFLEQLNNLANAVVPIQTDSNGDYDEDTTETINPPLVIGVTPSQEGNVSTFLWMEVIQDISWVLDPTVQIRGYAVGNIPVNEPGFVSLNNGDIAIGIIFVGLQGTNPGVASSNYIFDHARNRYPCGNGNWPASGGNGTALNFRGTFQFGGDVPDNVLTPSDLDIQLFYPGDEIIFSDPNGIISYFLTSISGTSIHSQVPWAARYVFTAATPAFMLNHVSGPFGDSNWTQLPPYALVSTT